MNFKKYHVSRNLFDKSAPFAETGKYLEENGSLGTSGAFNVTDFIECEANTDYALSNVNVSSNTPSVCFYDSTQNFISGKKYSGSTGINFITPSTCKYLKFSVRNDKLDEAMLNTGSQPLPYEPYGNTWHDIPHYIHNTSTDTITTLPAVLYPTGTTATVGLKGQTLQSSVPSPTSPVTPQGTGERTGNLWNEDYTGISGIITYKPLYVGEGTFTMSSDVEISAGSAGTLFLLAGDVSSGASTATNGVYKNHDVTTTAIDGYVTIAYRTYTVDTPVGKNSMLNTGSTALPYEPYGYKIPISSANTTTPVYLGEVQSERKISKYVFTGQEKPSSVAVLTDTDAYQFPNETSGYKREQFICSHMPVNTYSTTTNTHGYIGQRLTLCFDKAMGLDTTIKVQQYLADQYSAGTPVCVWYVLATPTTGIVNEPLMRIGNYADTLSNISIPVTAGGDTLLVGTTVQPSEVTVNYKGWHPVADVHERENGQWD